MPRWMVTCPTCSHKFTHTAIGPNCKTESLYQRLDLFYSEGG
jgi:hypothetical protein